MIARNEDALICDMAEFYNVYDYRALPVRTAAVLACGLPASSRTKCKLAGMKIPPDLTVLCSIFDQLAGLRWMLSADSAKGKNKPRSLLAEIYGVRENAKNEVRAFGSAADFEAARREFFKEGE